MAGNEQIGSFSSSRDTESEPECFAVKISKKHNESDILVKDDLVDNEVDMPVDVNDGENSSPVIPIAPTPRLNMLFVNLVFLTTIVRRIPCIIPPNSNPDASFAKSHQNQIPISYQAQLQHLPLRAILHTPRTHNNPKGIPNLTMTFLQHCYFGSCLRVCKNKFRELEPAEHLGRNKRLVERGVECECGIEGCAKLQREAGKGRRYPMRKKTAKVKAAVGNEIENQDEQSNTREIVEGYPVKSLRSGRTR
ncbi:hypothetical protein BGZ60DRAFT_564282 [Tricladium varicosporioides]|nr:hypothetical protein BGZ60DRAFT_564282 [Hymenoscyphus varicosporioides]